MKSSGKLPEEAIVDEEAILSLLENSQTFLTLSQTSSHSPLLGMLATPISTQLQSAHFLYFPSVSLNLSLFEINAWLRCGAKSL